MKKNFEERLKEVRRHSNTEILDQEQIIARIRQIQHNQQRLIAMCEEYEKELEDMSHSDQQWWLWSTFPEWWED